MPPVGARSAGAAWEFFDDTSSRGGMTVIETRSYKVDRAVLLHDPLAEGSIAIEDPGALVGGGLEPAMLEHPPEGVACATQEEAPGLWPAWVSSMTAERSGNEVRALVVASKGVEVDMRSLSLDVAPQVLKLELRGYEVFELALPAVVDVESSPVA